MNSFYIKETKSKKFSPVEKPLMAKVVPCFVEKIKNSAQKAVNQTIQWTQIMNHTGSHFIQTHILTLLRIVLV